MRGLSEEDVKRFIRAHNIDNEHNWIGKALLDECHELDPWLPIDENTPRDKCILLFYPKMKDKVVARWSRHFKCWITNFREEINLGDPTMWQELPEDPTCENSADT